MRPKLPPLKRNIVALLVIMLLLCSCAGKELPVADDIFTQTVLSPDKVPITVLVKFGININSFEKAAEQRFPALDLIQVGNYTFNGSPELAERFEHDDLTDIVMTWPLEAGGQYFDERLIDLSGMPFTSKYNVSMLDAVSQDGKLYYLPAPSELRGILYNKTLFEENGWVLPNSFEEFVSLCQTIEKSGIRALQLNFWNKEILDAAFAGFGYKESFSTPENTQKLLDYNQTGKGSLGSFAGGALDSFKRLIDENIIREGDLEVRYPYREKMLFERECAMIDDTSALARKGAVFGNTTDQFAMMPFWSPGSDGDWLQLNPSCYIGLNKKLADPQNKEKYNLVIQLMEYISSPEGQAVLDDGNGKISSLDGMEIPKTEETEALTDALAHGRYSIFPTLKNAQPALREGLAGMLRGELTKSDVIEMTDAQNASPSIEQADPVIGIADADFTMIETGNFVTDVMREFAGTDLSLFLDVGKDGKQNGKGISAKFYQGDLTEVDIRRILPVLQLGEAGDLWKVTMSGEDLLTTLEYSIGDGSFYYFSGLRVHYAPAAVPGSRIKKITDTDGNQIEPSRMYSVAITDGSVPPEFLKSCEKTGVLISDLLKNAIKESKTITPSKDGRFQIERP